MKKVKILKGLSILLFTFAFLIFIGYMSAETNKAQVLNENIMQTYIGQGSCWCYDYNVDCTQCMSSFMPGNPISTAYNSGGYFLGCLPNGGTEDECESNTYHNCGYSSSGGKMLTWYNSYYCYPSGYPDDEYPYTYNPPALSSVAENDPCP